MLSAKMVAILSRGRCVNEQVLYSWVMGISSLTVQPSVLSDV